MGLFVLDAQLRAGRGGLIDLLAVDGSGAFSILVIEHSGEQELLHRSLEHQSWVESQFHFLRHLYGAERIHPLRTPRVILLAPHFSPEFLRKVGDLPVSFTSLVYRLFPNGNGMSLQVEPAAEAPPPPQAIPRAFLGLADLSASAEHLTAEELAAGIQRSLMPRGCPPFKGYDIAGISHPCRPVGGDSYDFLARDGNRLWVTVGDVAGKGLSAAMIMSHFQALLRGLAESDRPVFQLVGRLNDHLSQTLAVNQFISFFLVELQAEESILRYVNAGHNPPILVRKSGEVDHLHGDGPVLGVVPGFRYRAHRTRMAQGDTLLIYTDGAIEGQNPSHEEFGEERLTQCLRKVASSPSRVGLLRLEQDILGFCGPGPRYDDITLLLIRRLTE